MSEKKAQKPSTANPMWGGHYDHAPDAIMVTLNASIHFDIKLYRQDIRGSIAHAEMLAAQKILTREEAKTIIQGLQEIAEEIAQGQMPIKPELEDIHMHVEARLKEKIGDLAGKLHTARSRNDQVATDFKLYIREAYDLLEKQLQQLLHTLLDRAEEHAETIMPGFTHLQTAQPVTLGHHLMAYVEMFKRDLSRLQDHRRRLNECPLGAAALAGTSFAIDREATAKTLGFDRPTANSLDSVSDRDFVLDFLSFASICATHLSRIGEELVVWSSKQFHFITLPQRYTTGSSIMPQKRNPDAAELIRAKSGRMHGALISLLTSMKSLPLAYSKDMQEDKEPAMDVAEQLPLCLAALEGMLAGMEVDKDAMRKAANSGFSTATDFADWLVRTLGLPFLDAHHLTGKAVKLAEEQGRDLADLSLEAFKGLHPQITKDIYHVLSVEASVASRTSFGGTAPEQVCHAIVHARKALEES